MTRAHRGGAALHGNELGEVAVVCSLMLFPPIS